ncbi:hydroxymethylglutaryl-CoA synthase family protein [Dickeya solani]|uniref:hydroxymethylglutaryl-CoA synthase family protein n=1 Tax=Dickeya solani TaxID=1089444 RepID=UPI0003A148A8|nr:hydroxymethylglutaryl-CoA synthase [Dickeya solani]ANE75001.1 3-hydroxy-3-methylglutaryl-ACP synthase [Dickeya solani IPO 2222]AUC42351.1 Hydroxymethylglutaryl-CoA synthase [Dickeya solani RNS 08.23.3.1.A]AUH09584.1 3-hydroxy-3-methylglutaryl-ACP synthase [Dickeya solani D s0432-1]AUH13546.1 3-hydroxy-3-methylglutaryl-ACP synthase [Dickeya solani]AYQ49531.1 Polyketide biosynthesis 3-hydroxy-3-methylglutaryl-ACP synthase PksG [Dickeya solani]
MISVGIEAINAFCGTSYINVRDLAQHRQLDMSRFDNLLMKQKTVSLPCEDPVSFAVNAAKPIVDSLSEQEKNSIELLITCTESGIDFGKSISTYVHHYLGLKRNCRLFELKTACYSGVAGLQMAVNTILSQTSPGSKALVIATDMTRFILEEENGDHTSQDWSFAEPSGGSGAVAMLVSDSPHVFQIDVGANGYYGYEVMDTCRPVPDRETGDSDLSLLAYLECCEKAYLEYEKRVAGIDYVNTFGYLAFHTPFGGMVKGAHRNMMRKLIRATPQDTEADFNRRVAPGLNYCQRVGNIMGATLALSLLSTLSNADIQSPQRIGCFSYGSGCCSEFFSGVVTPEGCQRVRQLEIGAHLDRRRELTMSEYDALLYGNHGVRFGTQNVTLDLSHFPQIHSATQKARHLVLSRINEFHREYEWV